MADTIEHQLNAMWVKIYTKKVDEYRIIALENGAFNTETRMASSFNTAKVMRNVYRLYVKRCSVQF